jgi:hypothetical protein
MLCCVALVRTDVSEELTASIYRVTRIGELGTTLAVTSNGHMLRACTLENLLFTNKQTLWPLSPQVNYTE